MKPITKTVWLLSLISLFTDMASEMLYPVMPVYLKSIGFSVLLIGVLEGVAEATAGLSKGYFGKLSDHTGRRTTFVRLGYGLSAIAKPLTGLFTAPIWIFFLRTTDRLGKGLRSGARDAILSAEATPATKGRVFGFHRSMDTLGAVIGPALALVWLAWQPAVYRPLFLIALVPGLLAVGCSFVLRDRSDAPKANVKPLPFLSFVQYWKTSPPTYRRLVAGLLAFALFNSSDVFLLLRARDAGLGDVEVIGLYILYNLVYAGLSYPLGILADQIGLKKVLIVGLLLFAGVYSGMAGQLQRPVVYTLFLIYGMYAAATEGISKAWISNLCAQNEVATAVGTYSAFQSLCTLVASSLAGFIWYRYGAGATFMVTSIVTLGVALYMIAVPYQNGVKNQKI